MKNALEHLLNFVNDNWELLAPVIYEILARVIPTKNNVSIVDNVVKIIRFFIPNKRVPHLTDNVVDNAPEFKRDIIDRTKHVIKCVTLLMILTTGTASAQLIGTFKALRLGVGNPPTVGVDTVAANLSPSTYPVGTVIREFNTDSLYMKYSDSPNYWGPVGGAGGGGAATSPGLPDRSIQFNDTNVFTGDAAFLYGSTATTTRSFILGANAADRITFTVPGAGLGSTNILLTEGSAGLGSGSYGPNLVQFTTDASIVTTGAGDDFSIVPGDNVILDPVNGDVVLNGANWSEYVIDQITAGTGGATITFNLNTQKQRSFVATPSIATPKTLALSNETVGMFFNFFIEITNVAAVLTVPADWSMFANFDGTDWTPPATGIYEFGGSFDDTNNIWYVKVSGPATP